MTRYILVDGTHGATRGSDFTAPNHPFAWTLAKAGVRPVSPQPFRWSTDIDGLWGKNVQWAIGGSNLFMYAVPPLCPESAVPAEELVIIAFSHGVQVALFAFASGMKGHFISVNPPIREDMLQVAKQARPNIRRWLNLYGNWKDIWAVLGAVCDGHLGVRRAYPEGFCDSQILVPGEHGAALRDTRWADSWPGWIAEVMK